MGSPVARLPSAAQDVLAALAAAPGNRPLLQLMHTSGHSVGVTVEALIRLESLGWVSNSVDGHRLNGSSPTRPTRSLPIAVSSAGSALGVHPLRCGPRALIDLGVARFGFREAARLRDELRMTIGTFRTAGQWGQALSVLLLRWAMWKHRACRFGQHDMVLRRDSSTAVAHSYFECVRCGCFRNSLFGDTLDAARTEAR